MTSRSSVPSNRRRTGRTAAVAGAVLLVLPLSACGGTAPPSRSAGATAAAPSPGPAGQPGVVGLVAAVKGNQAQVQNPSMGQVAVDLSAGTTITVRTAGTLRDVRIGDCVSASGTPTTTGVGLAARILTVSAPTGGSCTAQRRSLGTGRPSPGPRPSGMPNPSSGTRIATASGTVSAVSGGTVTVTGVLRGPGMRASPPPAGPVTVTTDNGTRIQRDARATRAAIRPGVCLAAVGPSNDIGAVQARTVSVFQPGSTGCTGGFGGRAGGGNG